MSRAFRWSLQDAKAQFSEIVRRSLVRGPQFVTRNGEEVVVVLSVREYARLTQQNAETLDKFLARSPLADVDLDLARPRTAGRRVGV